jgi:hypothetical protein
MNSYIMMEGGMQFSCSACIEKVNEMQLKQTLLTGLKSYHVYVISCDGFFRDASFARKVIFRMPLFLKLS